MSALRCCGELQNPFILVSAIEWRLPLISTSQLFGGARGESSFVGGPTDLRTPLKLPDIVVNIPKTDYRVTGGPVCGPYK